MRVPVRVGVERRRQALEADARAEVREQVVQREAVGVEARPGDEQHAGKAEPSQYGQAPTPRTSGIRRRR